MFAYRKEMAIFLLGLPISLLTVLLKFQEVSFMPPVYIYFWMMGLSHYIRNYAAFVANEIRRWLPARTGVKFKSVCCGNQYLHMVCLRDKPVLARFSSPHKCLTYFILFLFFEADFCAGRERNQSGKSLRKIHKMDHMACNSDPCVIQSVTEACE